MWINGGGSIYTGDCAFGDRVATPAEVTAWRAAIAAEPMPLVSAAQLIRALDQMGLLVQVNAAATAAGGLTLALWNRAPFFARSDPLIAGIAAAIGKTPADVDGLFVLAATL